MADPFDTPDNGALAYLDKPPPGQAPPPMSPTDQANARLGQYSTDIDKQIQKLDALSGQEADIYNRRGAAVNKATGAAMAASDKMTKQGDEALDTFKRNTETVQEFKPPDTRQAAMDWMAIAATFGAIAGARSRYHATTALNAFSGAMRGWAEGDSIGFQKNFDTWQANAEAASRNNEKALRQYEMTMQNAKLNLDQKMMQVQMIAAQDQDQLMAVSAQQKNITQVSELLDKKAQVGERYYEHTQTLIERRQQQEDKINIDLAKNGLMRKPDGSFGVDSEQDSPVERVAQAIANYQQAPLSSTGARGPMNRIIMARVMEINKDFNASKYTGQQAYERTAGTYGARVETATNEVDQLMPQALDAAQKLPRGEWVPINKLVQQYEAGKSDPRYYDFAFANWSLLNAYARAINPTGVPRLEDKNHAADLLSTATDQKSYEAVLSRMRKEVEASQRAVGKTRGVSGPAGQGQPPPPKPGTIEDGHRFKGGDPSDPKNWDAVVM
jgi:hypothetical protein